MVVRSFVRVAGPKAEPSVCAPTPTLRIIPASAHAAKTNEELDLLEIEKPGVIKLISINFYVSIDYIGYK